MFCPACGQQIADDSSFCAFCGAKVEAPAGAAPAPDITGPIPVVETPAGATPAPDATGPIPVVAPPAGAATAPETTGPIPVVEAPADAPSAPSAPSEKRRRIVIAASAAVTVAIAALIAVFVVVPMVGPLPESTVQLNIVAPGLDEGSSPIAVHVVGRDARGNEVDRTGYLNTGHDGLSLPDGTYEVTLLASPISAGGDLYQVEGVTAELVVDSANKEAAQTGPELVLQVADPSELPPDAIDAARQYAQEGGMPAEQVDALLTRADGEVERLARGTAFASAQVYRGALYVSDVRTNAGTVPVNGLPNANPAPAEAEEFLFAGGFYYYPDYVRGNGYATVGVHKVNLETGEDTLLSADAVGGSRVFYADGCIVFALSSNNGRDVAVVNAATGEAKVLDFGAASGLATFLGVWDGNAYMTSSAYGSPSRVLRCPLTGGQATEAFTLEEGASAASMHDGVIVATRSNKALGFDVDGNPLWSCDLSTQAQLRQAYPHGGSLCFLDQQGTLFDLNVHTGDVARYNTGVPRVLQVIYADDAAAYFCGGYDTSTGGIMGSAFDVFGFTFADSVLTDYTTGAADSVVGVGPHTDAHVSTADFEFDLPEYWRGKVEWVERTTDQGYSQVVVYPLGMGETDSKGGYTYSILEVTGVPADWPVTGGDIGGGLVTCAEGSTKKVKVWQTNWTYFAHEKLNGNRYAKQYPDATFETLVDLTTGGRLTYQDCRADANQLAAHEYAASVFDGAITVK